MIGTWHALVIDCKDPDQLATFYQDLLGMIRVQYEGDGTFISIGDAPDRPAIAFEKVADYQPPDWPGQEIPQQAHIDVRVKDLDLGEQEALALGAIATGEGGTNHRVFLDPQGHPFCLVAW